MPNERTSENRQLRSTLSQFTTREDGEELIIEGFFAVFNSNYEIWPGATESIAPGAFANTLGNDIRALINHDTTLVVGRNKAGTLDLREESRGLWGRIRINPNDQDAVNVYERVKRGDVDQCSIGFNIVSEETEFLPDGSVHWTIREIDLWEVSICTFPAYEETSIAARKRDYDTVIEREKQKWRAEMTARLKGEN
jgi:HK97 family phage prohead protease